MRPINQHTLTSSRGIEIKVKTFGSVDYSTSYQAMKSFAQQRGADAIDEVWLLQHPPVYTQGTACEMETLLPSDIPVVKTDRGGQITYHGPGQWVMYPLLNLRRHGIGVKSLVYKLEQCVINVIAEHNVDASRKDDAPGVYVDGEKIAALGLRIRRGNSYHGLSLNVKMDLAPFKNIDPCGYQGLQVTHLADLARVNEQEIGQSLLNGFVSLL